MLNFPILRQVCLSDSQNVSPYCAPMPSCPFLRLWELNLNKERILLAARIVDRKNGEFFNSRFDGECLFPVSIYAFGVVNL